MKKLSSRIWAIEEYHAKQKKHKGRKGRKPEKTSRTNRPASDEDKHEGKPRSGSREDPDRDIRGEVIPDWWREQG